MYSVAIPTYYSSKHIVQCLSGFVNIPEINEVIINDDGSSKEEYKNLNRNVIKIQKKLDFEIKIFKNKTNLGSFKNKYLAVSKCTNKNIYQIDSDNYLNNNSKNIFKYLERKKPLKNLFLPGSIFMVFEKKNFIRTKKSINKIIISQNDVEVNIDSAKSLLLQKTKSVIPVNDQIGFKWLLSVGNAIFDKNLYLDNLEEGYSSIELPLQHCSMALSYFWLKNGGNIEIIKDMSHYHRIHDKSIVKTDGDNTKISADYFYNKILKI